MFSPIRCRDGNKPTIVLIIGSIQSNNILISHLLRKFLQMYHHHQQFPNVCRPHLTLCLRALQHLQQSVLTLNQLLLQLPTTTTTQHLHNIRFKVLVKNSTLCKEALHLFTINSITSPSLSLTRLDNNSNHHLPALNK